MAQSDVFKLEGGSRFEGRRHGDSQQMKCAKHEGEDLREHPLTCFSHSVRKFRWAQVNPRVERLAKLPGGCAESDECPASGHGVDPKSLPPEPVLHSSHVVRAKPKPA